VPVKFNDLPDAFKGNVDRVDAPFNPGASAIKSSEFQGVQTRRDLYN
jgi:hypothetical protein